MSKLMGFILVSVLLFVGAVSGAAYADTPQGEFQFDVGHIGGGPAPVASGAYKVRTVKNGLGLISEVWTTRACTASRALSEPIPLNVSAVKVYTPTGGGWVKTNNLHSFRNVVADNQVFFKISVQWAAPVGGDPGQVLTCPQVAFNELTVYNKSVTVLGNWMLTNLDIMPNAAQLQSGALRFLLMLSATAPTNTGCAFGSSSMERGEVYNTIGSTQIGAFDLAPTSAIEMVAIGDTAYFEATPLNTDFACNPGFGQGLDRLFNDGFE